MWLWIVRGLIIVLGGFLGRIYIAANVKGIAIGVGIAVLIVTIEILLKKVRLTKIVAGVIGAIIGFLFARLLDFIVLQTDNPKLYDFFEKYSILIKSIFAYIGAVIAIQKLPEFEQLDQDILSRSKKLKEDLKILDTSSIIDGRIVDVVETKFLSGYLLIPQFILKELQSIADTDDPIKRAKGRRGLDILSNLRQSQNIKVKTIEVDYDIAETDMKLMRLAKDLNAKIITTDFNLNKLATFQGVTVLNINDLSNALKPIYLPGQSITIFVVKEGKEQNQGVGYLDDGTMVVVEDGRHFVGKRVDVVVTSILQTSSGRMIFCRVGRE